MNLDAIWKGTAHWADGGPLSVVNGIPKGGPMPDAAGSPYQSAPQYDPTEIFAIAKRLMKKM